MNKVAALLLYLALAAVMLNLPRAPLVSAAPLAQSTAAVSPTPTDEPPKAPYVFPTPIFIPTYPGDTPSAPPAPRTTGQPTGQDSYTVQSGDSPWTIAVKVYGDGTKYPQIMSANNLTDSTRLRVGMVLKIPQIAGSAPPAAPTGTPSASAPIAPVQQLTAAPAISPTFSATPTRTPASSGILPGSVADAANLAINIVAGILMLGAVVATILAFLVYFRTRRMQGLNTRKKRIQIFQ